MLDSDLHGAVGTDKTLLSMARPVFNIHVTRSSDQSRCKLIGPAGGSLVISAHPPLHSLTDGQTVDTATRGNI